MCRFFFLVIGSLKQGNVHLSFVHKKNAAIATKQGKYMDRRGVCKEMKNKGNEQR